MRIATEAGRLSMMLLMALAPVALAISHPIVSFVFMPLALLSAACSGRARASAADLLAPIPVAAGMIGVLGLISVAWAPDSTLAASKGGVFLLVVIAGAWPAAALARIDVGQAARLAVLLLWGTLAAAVLLAIQTYGEFLFSEFLTGRPVTANIAANKLNVSSAGMVILIWAVLSLVVRKSSSNPARIASAVIVLSLAAAIVFAGKGLAPKIALPLGALAWGAGRLWPRATAAMLGFGIIALSLALLIVPSRFYHSDGFRDFRGLDSSAKYRVDIWDNAAQWIRQKPVLGYGAGASQSMPPRQELSKITGKPRNIPLYPHNVLVQTMLELGIAGLLCLWVFFGALLRAIARLSPLTRPYALAGFASATGIWMIGYPLWRSAWLAWLGFCLLAFVVSERAGEARTGARK